jgi:hypothetical protein
MKEKELLTKQEAIKYLEIEQKNFDNYAFKSGEINGFKKDGRWVFEKAKLDEWKRLKQNRTVFLSMKEYEECFELAIKMAYSGTGHHGTGIRGARSEMQTADDWILGILAEFALRKFLVDKFNTWIALDTEAHPEYITTQDIEEVMEFGKPRKPKINVAVKASKLKSCFLVVPPLEYENTKRKSDVYIFVRVGLPSDHLFRILRDHSFFKNVKDFLEKDERFRKIEELKDIEVWICGFEEYKNLEKVTEIPGQKFEGHRYVKSVAKLKNSDEDWQNFIRML